MNNNIKTLAARKKRIVEKETLLLARAAQLLEDLKASFPEADFYAISKVVNLEGDGERGYIYGHLRYHHGALQVIYRTNGDDEHDYHYGIAGEDRTYSVSSLEDVAPAWRTRLLEESVLGSLLQHIDTNLTQHEARLDSSLSAFESALAIESQDLDATTAESVAALGNDHVIGQWRQALASLTLDPDEGLTRVYSFLETLCSAILHERRVPQERRDRSLQQVMKELVEDLGRAEPAKATGAAFELLKNMQGVSKNIGELRDRFSTAHGTLPGAVPLDPAYATLAKNAAATVAIFLLNRHRANPPALPASSETAPGGSSPQQEV